MPPISKLNLMSAVLGALLAAVLLGTVVLNPGGLFCSTSGEVCVTHITWTSAIEGDNTSQPQCLEGLPATTSGATVGTSSSIEAAIHLSVVPALAATCYVTAIGVAPSSFVYVNAPGNWFAVTTGFPLFLNISTPSSGFGPAPITITLYTTTEPFCMDCP
jgi:hypothetical protein